MRKARVPGPAGIFAALWAALLCACLPTGDRVAGSSTEAGNAGGKLSMADGKPAADVAVALVARSYLPDTAGGEVPGGKGDVAGSYYRTRTDAEGRFRFPEVAPGEYRMLAIGGGTGTMAESVVVQPGDDTSLIDQVMKPLGGIRGIAKIVGSTEKASIWVRPKATLKTPPRAGFEKGDFLLDSLPEGEYELIPQCFSCRPIKKGYRVMVKAGQDTVLADTLKLFPEYFHDFPDSGDLEIRSAWLPVTIGGKVNRGADKDGKPGSISWDWNGVPLAGTSVAGPDGISQTQAVLDSSLFAGMREGTLRIVLAFPDTNVIREWRVTLDTSNRIWPLSAVRVDSAVPVSGPLPHMWRFHVADSRRLDPADVAFWGVTAGAEANQSALPDWLYLAVENGVEKALELGDPSRLSFILVPDAKSGGKVLRPRWDENLEDFGEIRYLESARFGFTDTLDPSMLPGGLVVDRQRGPNVRQRYRVDSLGRVRELLGPLAFPDGPAGPSDPPALFYRYGAAANGFAWDRPLRDAAKALTVTRDGRAIRLDGSGIAATVPAPEMDALRALLAPLALDPPGVPDTGAPASSGGMEYAWGGGRGLLRSAGSGAAADSFFAALQAWIVRNGLQEPAGYSLSGAERRYLAFEADSAGIRYTGDTLVTEAADSGSGVRIREYLSAGSPGRPADSSVAAYVLKPDRDSLVAVSGTLPAVSRLYGRIDGESALFALTGLKAVSPRFEGGLPILSGDGNTLSGRLTGSVEIHGRSVAAPGIWLDGRGIARKRQGLGFLYTPEGGLERAWRFGGSDGTVKGWDRE
ncbi:MAG TPA: hypothetical protein VJ385_00120 [Fibrobacteria bacterium]|nr:hypothetical protein [Fibrobacteria bacterium]